MYSARQSFILLTLLLTPFLVSCQSTAGTNPDGSINLVKEGQLTVCTNPPYRPFEFEQDGRIVGFDADIAQAMADRLGVELNMASTGFEGIDSGASLITGQCDIAISGITVSSQRRSKMDFSIPYLDDNLALLVGADSSIDSVDDIAGRRVGAQQATSGQSYAQEQGADLVQYEDSSLLIQSLQTGQVEAVVANISILSAALAQDSQLKIVSEIQTGEQLAAAVSQANPAMLELANTVIKDLKDSGKLAELQTRWLGVESSKPTSSTESTLTKR
ncbi:MAG: ABC transporter substrate-binding protein [Rothia sp. (in: high G+C Gram-positive bacteria)]|nr:ABC transporter substrate-binding protein [Rothia sp. (in: high G+C Gram-positive bacteria)]